MAEPTASRELKLKCKETGCSELVVWKRKVVFNLVPEAGPEAVKSYYLTCPAGHTNVYYLEG